MWCRKIISGSLESERSLNKTKDVKPQNKAKDKIICDDFSLFRLQQNKSTNAVVYCWDIDGTVAPAWLVLTLTDNWCNFCCSRSQLTRQQSDLFSFWIIQRINGRMDGWQQRTAVWQYGQSVCSTTITINHLTNKLQNMISSSKYVLSL